MKASAYGIKNLQRIVPNLIEWTRENGEDYGSLREMYNSVVGQYSLYMGHVSNYVGGIMETAKTADDNAVVYEIVPKNRQKEAVEFFNKQLFTTPAWLIDQNIFNRIGSTGSSVVGSIQDNVLNRLLGARTMNKLLDAETTNGNNAYTLLELLSDMKKGIWSELGTRKSIDIYRRNLQKSYVNILIRLINPPSNSQSGSIGGGFVISSNSGSDRTDTRSVVRAHLAVLKGEISQAAASVSDPMTRYHLQDVANRIDNALNPK
jgi:hypothetical protein